MCVSVTFVDHVKTNKDIFEFFSPSGSHTISVFSHAKRHSNIPTGTPLTGASNAGGVGRNRDSEPISGLTACVNAATAGVVNAVAGGPGPPSCKLLHIAGSKRRC